MRAVIYARYSSDRQTADSIVAQVRACREYAEKNNIIITHEYVDEAISGKQADGRKQYQKMIQDGARGLFDTILVHKYDRINRNTREHLNLEQRLLKAGIELIAVAQDFGDGSTGKLLKNIILAISEFYSDNLADETRKGLREAALKGLHTGGVALFGYDIVDKKHIINPLEAEYVVRMFQCCASRMGYAELLQEMELRGIKGKRGKTFSYSSIYEILKNEKYTGKYAYSPTEEKNRADRRSKPNAIVVPDAIPKIVEKVLFDEVQKIMESRKQVGPKTTYRCSGLVYCSCGGKMHINRTTRKGHTYTKYLCSKKCGAGGVPVDAVDSAAFQYLKELLSPENQKLIAQAVRDYQVKAKGSAGDFKQAIKQEIDAKQKQHDALLTNLSSGALPAPVVAEIGQKIETLMNEIEALKNTPPPKDFTVERVVSWLEALKSAPDDEAIPLLIERIDVKKQDYKIEFNIKSTLNALLEENRRFGFINEKPTTSSEVAGETGCGDRI